MNDDAGNKLAAVQKKEEGNKAYLEKRFEEALGFYDEAILLDPTQISFYNNKGAVYIEQQKFQQAKDVCKQAQTIGKNHGAHEKYILRSLGRVGRACMELGELSELYNAMNEYEDLERMLNFLPKTPSRETLQVSGAVKRVLQDPDTLTTDKIMVAGKMIKHMYCSYEARNKLHLREPAMFPPAPQQTYVDAFTDADTSGKCLKEKVQQLQYEAECDLYRALENLRSPFRNIIVLHSFKFWKEQAEIFGYHSNGGEHDFVVIVEYFPLVLFEVKSPMDISDKTFKRNLDGSRKQLKRMSDFINCICKTLGIDQSHSKRVVQFSVFPRTLKDQVVDFPSYKKLSEVDAKRILFKGDVKNFGYWWGQNISYETMQMGPLHTFSTSMRPLESTLLGLWNIDQKNICDLDICSLGYCIKIIDTALRSEQISRNVSAPVSKNIRRSPPVFENFLGLKSLTQEQMDIFESNRPCQIILGPAGSGKTVLLLGKIIECAEKAKKANTKMGSRSVFFTASLQYEEYLEIFAKAGLTTEIGYELDSDGQSIRHSLLNFECRELVDVYIYHHTHYDMMREKIQHVVFRDNLCLNIFIDDMHNFLGTQLQSLLGKNCCEEISESNNLLFIINAMKNNTENNTPCTFWAAFDQMQFCAKKYYAATHSCSQFYDDELALFRYYKTARDTLKRAMESDNELFSHLTRNLRTTVEIDSLIKHCRLHFYISDGINVSTPISDPGHFIHGPKPHLVIVNGQYHYDFEDTFFDLMHFELYKLLCMGDKLEPRHVAVINATLEANRGKYDHVFNAFKKLGPEFSKVTYRSNGHSNHCLQSSEWKAVLLFLDVFAYDKYAKVFMRPNQASEENVIVDTIFAEYLNVKLTRGTTYLSIVLIDRKDIDSVIDDEEYKRRPYCVENVVDELFEQLLFIQSENPSYALVGDHIINIFGNHVIRRMSDVHGQLF